MVAQLLNRPGGRPLQGNEILIREALDFAARKLGVDSPPEVPVIGIRQPWQLHWLLHRKIVPNDQSKVGALYIPQRLRPSLKVDFDIGFATGFDRNNIFDRARAVHEATHLLQDLHNQWDELGYMARERQAEEIQAAYADWYERAVLASRATE